MDWILIVDDDEETKEHAVKVLEKNDVKVTKLSSGRELLDYIEGMTPLPDLILLDVEMPEMSGFETYKLLREKIKNENDIPVIFLTGNDDLNTETQGLMMGAVDFIRKPYFPEILTLRVKRTIELSRLRRDLSKEVDKKIKENTRLTLHVVQTLAEAIDAKDTYTNGHSGRVATYSRMIAERLGYDEDGQDKIYMMGLLHDVGKIGVPDWIINKTDKLTDEEFAEIKKHPDVGNRILKRIKEMPTLAYGARWHHERIDGKGYPDGLKGNEIPEEARIIAVADAYDAMTSNRSYRKSLPQAAVRQQIINGKGTQFDEHIADVMIAMIDADKDYAMREGFAEKAGLNDKSESATIRHMDGQTQIPEKLSGLEQLDTALGLYLCGDVEDYIEALSIFAGSADNKAAKIKNAVDEQDIENYTTLVHSLKSSARTIGAVDLSEMARTLEMAGKDKKLDLINTETSRLLSDYRTLVGKIKTAL